MTSDRIKLELESGPSTTTHSMSRARFITSQINIVSPQFKANPFPFFASLRTSQPVYRSTLPDKTPVWLITRYDDVLPLLRDERFVKNKRTAMTPEQLRKMPWVPPMFRPLERNMLDLDSPDHTRLRGLVHKAFTPNLVGRMRNRIGTLSDELLGRIAGSGEMDLINDYALPLPMTIITEILGVPTNDRDRFHRWSKAVVSLSSPSVTLRVIPSVWMFIRYLRKFFEMRRQDPRDDLASALILIALTSLWCDPLIPRSHAQQAQTVTSAVQVIGIVGVKENTKGTRRW